MTLGQQCRTGEGATPTSMCRMTSYMHSRDALGHSRYVLVGSFQVALAGQGIGTGSIFLSLPLGFETVKTKALGEVGVSSRQLFTALH